MRLKLAHTTAGIKRTSAPGRTYFTKLLCRLKWRGMAGRRCPNSHFRLVIVRNRAETICVAAKRILPLCENFISKSSFCFCLDSVVRGLSSESDPLRLWCDSVIALWRPKTKTHGVTRSRLFATLEDRRIRSRHASPPELGNRAEWELGGETSQARIKLAGLQTTRAGAAKSFFPGAPRVSFGG